MNSFRNLFKDQSITNIEIALLRAYVLFDIAQRLLTLTVVQVHEAGQKIGLW